MIGEMMSWGEMRQELKNLAKGNKEYAEFNKRIVNTKQNLIGVRMPDLRKLAKKVARGATLENISKMLDSLDKMAYEEILLVGLIISYVKNQDKQKIDLMRRYLKLVDNWAQIDSVAMTDDKFDKELWWRFVLECLKSADEFVVRYGVIFAMCNFATDEKLHAVFEALPSVKHEGYYVKMGLAWLYATVAVKYYEQTLAELNKPNLDSWTRKKAYTKMLESYRFSDKQKAEIRALRAKIKV